MQSPIKSLKQSYASLLKDLNDRPDDDQLTRSQLQELFDKHQAFLPAAAHHGQDELDQDQEDENLDKDSTAWVFI